MSEPLLSTADARRVVLRLSDRAGTEQDAIAASRVLDDLCAQTMRALNAGLPNPDLLLDEDVAPGIAAWMALRKQAIALHPLYAAPDLDVLGGGLTMSDLDEPLDDGTVPFEALADIVGAAGAARVRERYRRFLDEPVNESSKVLLFHSLDSRAIRWRAEAATVLTREAAADWTSDVTAVSLACGAAGPLARLVDGLVADGHTVAAMHLLDRDPVALAAGRVTARRHLDPSLVRARVFDLVDLRDGTALPLTPVLEVHSAHLIDILGLFEYLPDATAVSLLKQARAVLRPDGVVVLANMVTGRPEQNVLSHVIQWPSLIQRSVDDLLALIEAAGFDATRATIATAPSHESVYAVAAVRA